MRLLSVKSGGPDELRRSGSDLGVVSPDAAPSNPPYHSGRRLTASPRPYLCLAFVAVFPRTAMRLVVGRQSFRCTLVGSCLVRVDIRQGQRESGRLYSSSRFGACGPIRRRHD